MKERSWVTAAYALGISAVLLVFLSVMLAPTAQTNRERERNEMMARLLPGSSVLTPEGDGGEEAISSVYKGEGGYVIETVTHGYAGDIVLLVGADNRGTVTGVVVRDMEETWRLGGNALWDVEFLSQFLGSSGQLEVGKNVDVLTGATVTTKAIVKGINAACAYITGADVDSSATEWEG